MTQMSSMTLLSFNSDGRPYGHAIHYIKQQQALPQQVSLGGTEHSLTAFAACCPTLHIIDRPLIFLDALWLPYRRDKKELEAAIRASGNVKATFGHADVVSTFDIFALSMSFLMPCIQ